jgi:hypothetical protein
MRGLSDEEGGGEGGDLGAPQRPSRSPHHIQVLCGASVWARRALDRPKWRFPARAVAVLRRPAVHQQLPGLRRPRRRDDALHAPRGPRVVLAAPAATARGLHAQVLRLRDGRLRLQVRPLPLAAPRAPRRSARGVTPAAPRRAAGGPSTRRASTRACRGTRRAARTWSCGPSSSSTSDGGITSWRRRRDRLMAVAATPHGGRMTDGVTVLVVRAFVFFDAGAQRGGGWGRTTGALSLRARERRA